MDYTSKVDEKQFLDVRKGRKSRESKIEVHCGQFAGQAHSPYFTAPSLHGTNYGHKTQQSCGCLKDERNCRQLALLPGTVPILHGSLLNHMTIITKVGCPTLIT